MYHIVTQPNSRGQEAIRADKFRFERFMKGSIYAGKLIRGLSRRWSSGSGLVGESVRW